MRVFLKCVFFSKNVKLLGSNKEGVYIIHLIHVISYIYYVRLFLKCTDFGDDVMFIILLICCYFWHPINVTDNGPHMLKGNESNELIYLLMSTKNDVTIIKNK